MPSLRVTVPAALLAGALDLDALRAEVGAPGEFSTAALLDAAAGAAAPRLPALDRTDLPLITVDPPGSMDLDQALHLEQRGDGYRVWYAIADPAAFLAPGGALDRELVGRGITLHAPDRRTPLHPPVLGEDAASLLPDVVRPAVLWRLDLGAGGELGEVQVQRALVRSRARLTYDDVQEQLAGPTPEPTLLLLRTVGRLLQQRARERGAVDVATPGQEVTVDNAGRPTLALRAQLPSEGWNAQLSLLTGRAAARLMLAGGTGLLRTLPPPDTETIEALRRSARALDVPWLADRPYGEFISDLDPGTATGAALLTLATRLLRGAGYTAFAGGAQPEQPVHSAVAAPYAHTTAPLRRLADRYVSEVCVALCAGEPVPGWASEALPGLPEVMAQATRRASALERWVVDASEALVLTDRVGERFAAVVVGAGDSSGLVQLREPPVRARCEGGDLPLGEAVVVELVTADPAARTVLFRRVAATLEA